VDYATLKALHVACVVASIAGFAARYALMLAGSPLLQARAVRVIPHVVDTLLLASAVAMLWQLSLNPFRVPWLAAKIFALLAYIVLGALALRRAPSARSRAIAGVAAILAFAYIVSVALTKSPLAWPG